MKKKILFLLVALILVPMNIFAESGQSGDNTIGKNLSSSTSTGDLSTANYWVATRITYIDENAEALTDSFDFMAYKQNPSKNTFWYNGAARKAKIKGTYSFNQVSPDIMPTMATLYSNFVSACANVTNQDGKKIECKYKPYSHTGKRNLTSEQVWFNSLTLESLTEDQYMANIKALGIAISKSYSFNADQMTLDLIEACQSGKEIFVQMEAMYTSVSAVGNILGTTRDQIFFYKMILDNSGVNYLTEFLNKVSNSYWVGDTLLHYPKNLPSKTQPYLIYSKTDDIFKGAGTEVADSKYGYGVIVDWANNMGNSCTGCTFVDGTFKYDDKDILPSDYSSSFSHLYEYALSDKSAGGLDCCNSLKTELEKGTTITDELKEYYDFYCNSDEGEPCTTKEAPETGEKVFFCLDGKKCEEETFKEQCGKPECKPDPNDPEDPENTCCTTDPIEQGKIEGEVNNCCADGTESEAHEYDLDELFCNNNYLGVANYQYKCGADYYQEEDTDLDDDYCKMYCTERVSVEIPGALTAISGRYFKLTETSKGTKSPYIEGFKRCRVIVNYSKWEQDYYDIVKDQVEAYNEFQKNKANELMYQDAIDASTEETEKTDITQSCTKVETSTFKQTKCSDKITGIDKNKCYNVTQTQSGTSNPVTTGKTVTSCKSGDAKDTCYITKTTTTETTTTSSCTIKYTKYPYKKMYDIYSVKIDEEKRDDCENIFEAIEIAANGKTKTKHDLDWTAWNIDTSDCTNKVNDKTKTTTTTNSKTTCTAERSNQSEAEKRQENVPELKDKFAEAAKNANTVYNSASDIAKELENTIDVCDKYFTDYKGAKAEENYKFDAKQAFSYTQIYLDEHSQLKMDEIFVDFEETPGCVIDSNVVTGPDSEDKLSANRYSSNKYGTGSEKMTDFKNMTLEHQDSANGFKKYQDETYAADKIFTLDAKYHATCSWDEGENIYYTLVPSGSASESTSEINYTKHGQEYKVYLSTLEGTYETYWDISGLGSPRKGESAGRFDQFFKDAGDTCSAQDPNDKAMLTCKINSEHEVVLTGYCNGSNGTDTTINPDDCDPYKEGYRLFNFKVVDPKNIFPSGTNTVDGDIAYNWVVSEKGKATMQEIQSTAERGMTYSPDTLSYSYILTPTDMRHVKNYNSGQIEQGGYSDFTLQCSKQSCEAGGCDQCKSPFLENLSSGRITYSGTSHDVTGWGNKNKDLTSVRKNYGWN